MDGLSNIPESTMVWLILFHAGLILVPCLWLSLKIMYEELKNHELSWRVGSYRPAAGFRPRWA